MKIHFNWNTLGISAAVACAIHCALLPLFISTLPLFGINLLHNIFFETGMIALALIIGGINLWHGYRRHHHHLVPLVSFFSGMMLLVLHQFVTNTGIWLVIPSSLLIILAYYLNWKFCRLAKHCHATDCNH
jgi:predicted neutral ceramidase superfamily lipid hydrolase